MELALAISQLAWFLWPLIFFGALLGVLGSRGNILRMLPRMLNILLALWLLWAFMWLLLRWQKEPLTGLIPEPANSRLFWISGILVLIVQGGNLFVRRWLAAKRLRTAQDLDALRALTPSEFEQLVADTYQALGSRVSHVGDTGDHGVDLLVETQNGEKWVVQCKRWQGRVGEPVIRDLYGVMRHEEAERGVIVTTGAFTRQARVWAQGKPIDLHSGEDFLEIIERARTEKR